MSNIIEIQKYLKAYNLDSLLADAFEDLLKHRPQNEIVHLSSYLSERAHLFENSALVTKNIHSFEDQEQSDVETAEILFSQQPVILNSLEEPGQRAKAFTAEDLAKPFVKKDQQTVTLRVTTMQAKENDEGKKKLGKAVIAEVSSEKEEDESSDEVEATIFDALLKPQQMPVYSTIMSDQSSFENRSTQLQTYKISSFRLTLEGLKGNYDFIKKDNSIVGVALRDIVDTFLQDYKDCNSENIMNERIIENQTIIQNSNFHSSHESDLSSEVSHYLKTYSKLYSQIIGVNELARGGESIVFRINHVGKDEVVIKRSLSQQENKIKQRNSDYNSQLSLQGIMSESQTLKLLQSDKHICRIKEEIIKVDEQNGLIKDYLVVQEKARFSLEDLLGIWGDQEKSSIYYENFTPEKLAYYFLQAAQILAYLHQRNVFYGDMKPQNLLVFKDQLIKIGDFGTAIKMDTNRAEQDKPKYEITGFTVAYQSEQFYKDFYQKKKQSRQQLIAADIFSLIRTFQYCIQQTESLEKGFDEHRRGICQQMLDILINHQNLELVIQNVQMAFILDERKYLTLINQMKSESKPEAILHILYLSRFKSFLSANLSPLITDFQNQALKQKNVQLGKFIPELDQLNESSFQKFSQIQFHVKELQVDANFKETLLLAMIALKGMKNSEGKCLPNTKKFFDTFNVYFSMQETIPSDIRELKGKILGNKSIQTPLIQQLLQKDYLSKQNVYKKILQDQKPYLQYFQFISYRLFLDDGKALDQFSILEVLSKDILDSFKEKICALYLLTILETTNSLQNLSIEEQDEDYTKVDFYLLDSHEIVRNNIRANQIHNHVYLKEFQQAQDQLSSTSIEDTYKSLQFHEDNKYKVACAYLHYLIEIKDYDKAFKQASGWLERYQQLNGDSDPITLEFYGYAGEALMYLNNQIGIQYLTKYSKVSLQTFCRFLILLEKFSRQDVIRQNLPADVATKFLKADELNSIFELVFFGTFSANETQKIIINLSKLLLQSEKTELDELMRFKQDLDEQKPQIGPKSSKDLRDKNNPYADKMAQAQAIANTMSVYIIFMRFLKSFGQDSATILKNAISYEATDQEEKINSYTRIIKLKQLLKPLYSKILQFNQNNGYDPPEDLEKNSKDIDKEIEKAIEQNQKKQVNEIVKPKLEDIEKLGIYKKMILPNGATFIGEYKDGKREGFGFQFWQDGSVYEGEFKNDQVHGLGKLFHADGDYYEGLFVNEKADGHGTYIHSYGAKYFGEWKEDQKHGKGIEIWTDGAKFEGNYNHGKRDKQGKLIFGDGSIYQGEFEGNNIQGKGKYTWQDGKEYVGQWMNNKMHGQGILQWADGKSYEGQFVDDKRDGLGLYMWSDGRSYYGQWKKGKQHGVGEYAPAQGIKRKGEWENGKRVAWITDEQYELMIQDSKISTVNTNHATQLLEEHENITKSVCQELKSEMKDGKREGFGKMIWQDGSFYKGQWKNDMANGEGKLTHADGDIYEGDWLNDKANGKGIYIHANGAKYEGDWVDDKQHGYGIETFIDGGTYRGQFKDGKKCGKGHLHLADENTYEGEFDNNEINGHGKYIWKDGKIYEGEWKKGKMNGKGILRWLDGKRYEGQFKDDKRDGLGIFFWGDGRKYIGQWVDGKQHGQGEYTFANGKVQKGIWIDGERKEWLDE